MIDPGSGPRDPIRVGLLWHSTRSYNLGVGALTAANIALARKAAEQAGVAVRFVIIGMRDLGPEYISGDDIDVFEVTTRSLALDYPRLLGKIDCLLDIGAGDSFADIYGLKRFLFLWWSKVVPGLRDKPLLFSPQTIGPFRKVGYKSLASAVMTSATAVMARDQMSFDAAKKIAPRARTMLSTDVAFALPFERRAKTEGQKTRVGLNVSGMLFNEATSGRNKYGLSYDYAALTRRLLAEFSSDPRYSVDLICHVSAPDQPVDDDGLVADGLAKEFPGVTRVADFASPSEAKSYISGLDFLIAGRMHACIAAFSSGVPFAATAYSRKFAGLFGAFDYPGILPQTGIDEEAAATEIQRLFADRADLARDIEQKSPRIDALLEVYVGELSRFFSSVSARA